MKTLIVIFFIANTSFAAGIKGSKHDFSKNTWSEGEICKVCHIPHGATAGNIDAPLWDHKLTTQTFTPYTDTRMKAATGQPDGLSKLCLSCHDGTVAIDSFNGVMGTTFIKNKIGPNLKTGQGHWKHPISIVYDTNLSIADTKIYDPAVKTTVLGGTVKKDLLFNDKVQCASCHDVHDKKGIGTLLRITENTLCLTCHRTKP
jgi:predicted CXXCH cytochrome family protein